MIDPKRKNIPRFIGSGGGGGKGGGSQGAAPVEAPNTLQSRATARVVDLLGEGENVGLVAGAKSISFDNTDLQNDDGTYNFTGVTWAERTGTPSQDFLPGFPEVLSENPVGVELINDFEDVDVDQVVLNGSPVIQSFSPVSTNVTVQISFPNGLNAPGPGPGEGYYDPKIAATVSFAIDIQDNGGGYVEVASETVTELSQTEITRAYTFGLTGGGPWDIRVRRLTAAQPPTTVDEMRFDSYSYSNSSPTVRTITDTNLTAVRITVRLPQGLFQQESTTGNVNPSVVEIAIDLKVSGGIFTEQVRDTITGKTTTPYERAYRIELPEGTGPWDIRVRRLTPSGQGINITNDVTWASITNILDSKIRYVDSHVIGIAVDAEAFGGNVPTRAYHIKGRIIQVPSNYDPETREYTGVWDGTFQLAWSNNPAWCFYDMVMHPRYGLGEFVTEGGLKWDLYPIAQYCDELIDDGNGGLEPRFTFNGGFQTPDEANKVIQAMASVFRGMSWWSTGGIAASCDMPADPVKIVSPANVKGGNIELAGTALKARHTVALVQWNDPEDGYRINIEVVEDADSIERFGWRPIPVAAIACTSQGQAARVGRWILDSERFGTQATTYIASWDHADVQPGEIVNVADPAFSGVRRAGRIAAVVDDGNSPALYQAVVVDAPETLVADIVYTIWLAMPDGTLASSELSNSPGTTDTFTLADPLPVAPLVNAMWVLTGDDVMPRPFRVLAVKENENHLFEIAGIFHDETKYARVEEGFKIEPPVFSTIQTGPILPPTNLNTQEYLFLAGGTTVASAVNISWQAPNDPRVQFYEIQVRSEGMEWQTRATTSSVSEELYDFGSGVFDFRVRALDGAGRPSVWVPLLGVLLNGLFAPPENVQNFNISVLNDTATLTWAPVGNLNLSHYVIRYSSEIGATWQTSITLLDNIATTSVQVPALAGTFSIKAETLQEVRSLQEALIYNEVTNFNQLNAVEVLIEQPTFTGVKEQIILNPDYDAIQLAFQSDMFGLDDFFENPDFFLQSGGFFTNGTYYFSDIIDLGEVFTSRVTAIVEAFGVNFSADFFEFSDFFQPADFFRVESDKWDVVLQISFTSDDPGDSPAGWSEWSEFIIGDYTARAFRFRALLSTVEFGLTPVVSRLEINVDMPDRIIAQEDLVVTVAGRRIDFLPPFRALTGVSISAQGLATGDYYLITNKDRYGFDIIFKNSANAAVQRTLDHVSVGYGMLQ